MIKLIDNTVFNPETGEFGNLPNIVQFDVDRNLLIDETPATVTWRVDNAKKVFLNNVVVDPTGSQIFHSHDTINLTLTAENELGQTNKNLLIDIDRTPPKILSFNFNKPIAIKGSTIELEWTVSNASSLFIDNGVGNITDRSKTQITIGDNAVYTLVAKNHFGFSSSKKATITIYPTPVMENLIVPIPDFTSRLSLSPIQISSPQIDVSINLNRIYLDTSKLLEPINDLKSTRPAHMERSSIFNISKVYDVIRRKISI